MNTIFQLNHLQANFPFLYLLKTSEKQRFFYVFRECRKVFFMSVFKYVWPVIEN